MSTRRRRPVKKINKNMKKKLAVLFSLVLLALVGLVARITYINATSGSKYRKDRGTRHEAPSLPLPDAERAPLPRTLRPADRLRQETRSQARLLRAVRTVRVEKGL